MTIHFLAPEDKDKWGPIWHKCFESWSQTKHDISVWTDEGIDKLLVEDDEEFYINYLNKIPNIYKWDYVRYIILERYGGMYVDMDVELVDDSFFNKLDPYKSYFMEGTLGTLIENSLMISPLNLDLTLWNRLKMRAKTLIISNFEDCNNPYKVIHYVGAWMISEIVLKYFSNKPFERKYEILGCHQFANLDSTISFTKHHQTSVWAENGFNKAKIN
jgi:mannosyltransferase OCH1-like enzyme